MISNLQNQNFISSSLNFHSGEQSDLQNFINIPNSIFSLEDLKKHSFKNNNGKSQLLIVELNHAGDENSKFVRSGKYLTEVENLLLSTKHISIYTGLTDLPSNSDLENVMKKRNDDFEFSTNMTPVNFTVINQIAGFNYWFPGWFWEMSFIVIIIFSIGSFGIFQLFNLPVTERLATVKKLKNQ